MNAGIRANKLPDALTNCSGLGDDPRQAQFPVGIGLGEEGVDQGFQLVWVGGVEGGEDGDEGGKREGVDGFTLGFEGEGGGVMRGEPSFVILQTTKGKTVRIYLSMF